MCTNNGDGCLRWPRLRTRAFGLGVLVVVMAAPAVADPGSAPVRSTRGITRLPTVSEAVPASDGRDWLHWSTPLTEAQMRRVREIAARSDRRDLHSFAKVGDSMTVSRSFLTCFGRSEEDLGEFAYLASVVEHFRRRDAATDPFRRESLAASVGWSARSAIAGFPSPLVREIRTTRPRFATVMFGTNDIEARSPRRFARTMWALLEMLEARGVVPLVSTIPPRADLEDDRWVPRYNLVIRALTEGRNLPLYDLHADLERLPRRGLAADGLHANVLVEDGRGHACDFRGEGLDYGHNVRNLRVLQQLDRLVAVVSGYPVDAVTVSRDTSRHASPLRLPASAVVSSEPDAVHRWRFALDHPATVRVVAVSKEGDAPVATLRSSLGEVLGEGLWGTSSTLSSGTYEVRVAVPVEVPTELLVTVSAETF